jgi:hypothetical protein
MWPLVLANGMMADPHVARAGWREFKGDPILSGIQRDKALGNRKPSTSCVRGSWRAAATFERSCSNRDE